MPLDILTLTEPEEDTGRPSLAESHSGEELGSLGLQTRKPTAGTAPPWVVCAVSLFKKQNTANCHRAKKCGEITVVKSHNYSVSDFLSTIAQLGGKAMLSTTSHCL